MEDSQQKQAMITSLRLLAATPKSRNQLARRLSEKGYVQTVVRETLDQLEKQGLLNDRGLAQELKSRFTQAKPSGRKRLVFEMKRRGIPEKVREEVLGELNPEDEQNRAREAGLLRWQKFKNLPLLKRKKRVYDFLLRRGFDYSTVRSLVERFESQNDENG